jgi:hypothetical protein
MSVMAGFDNLKARDVLAFNADGTVLVVINDKVERFQLQLGATGTLSARPVEKPGRDQVQERKAVTRQQRLAMTDQGKEML